jgi:multicomponent Na+:H+ antiporter subunit F
VIDQFGVATAAILVCMAMTLIRSIAGPTVFDRVLAVNSFGTKTVLLIAVYGFLSGRPDFLDLARPDFLDLALVYALMNFIGTIAVMKFTRFGDLAGMEEDEEEIL